MGKKKKFSTTGDWIAKDLKGWRVRVPTANGNRHFPFGDHGGSEGAYNAAKIYHDKMVKQLESDRKYEKKTGEKVIRESLHPRNRSGVKGVSIDIYPNLIGNPTIVYTASWTNSSGKRCSERFSTANPEHKNAEECFRKAKECREYKSKHHK